jgi:hypothetical protein
MQNPDPDPANRRFSQCKRVSLPAASKKWPRELTDQLLSCRSADRWSWANARIVTPAFLHLKPNSWTYNDVTYPVSHVHLTSRSKCWCGSRSKTDAHQDPNSDADPDHNMMSIEDQDPNMMRIQIWCGRGLNSDHGNQVKKEESEETVARNSEKNVTKLIKIRKFVKVRLLYRFLKRLRNTNMKAWNEMRIKNFSSSNLCINKVKIHI